MTLKPGGKARRSLGQKNINSRWWNHEPLHICLWTKAAGEDLHQKQLQILRDQMVRCGQRPSILVGILIQDFSLHLSRWKTSFQSLSFANENQLEFGKPRRWSLMMLTSVLKYTGQLKQKKKSGVWPKVLACNSHLTKSSQIKIFLLLSWSEASVMTLVHNVIFPHLFVIFALLSINFNLKIQITILCLCIWQHLAVTYSFLSKTCKIYD